MTTSTKQMISKLAIAGRRTVALALLVAAGTLSVQAQQVTSTFDSQFDKQLLQRVESVAIIPNRLPLVL